MKFSGEMASIEAAEKTVMSELVYLASAVTRMGGADRSYKAKRDGDSDVLVEVETQETAARTFSSMAFRALGSLMAGEELRR